MPTPSTSSPLKRSSAGGRLRRLLASLRPPARAGPLPVQTGFPTSLADLVVKNHGRLKKPTRKRHHRATPAPPPAAAAAAEPAIQPQRRQLSAAQDAAAPAPAASRHNGRIRPELLAVSGVMALAMLVIWSKRLVAAATLASVALFWIESVRYPVARRRRPLPEAGEEEPDSRGRGLVSPIREAAESPVETPRPSSAASDTGSEVSDTTDLAVAGDDPGSISPEKRKEKRRSLRKLLAKKLQNGKRAKEDTASRHGGDGERPGGAGKVSGPEPAVVSAPAEETAVPPPEVPVTNTRRHRRRGGALPLAAFVPVVLVGLVAGKLPAVMLTVLCAVFFTSVERVPDTAAQASDPR